MRVFRILSIFFTQPRDGRNPGERLRDGIEINLNLTPISPISDLDFDFRPQIYSHPEKEKCVFLAQPM